MPKLMTVEPMQLLDAERTEAPAFEGELYDTAAGRDEDEWQGSRPYLY